MLSCGQVKTELFETADVTASIYDVSEHAHGSLGITQGLFDCLCSFVEVRTAKFECSSVFVWTGILLKTLLVGTRILLIRIKKMRFQKYPDTCGQGLNEIGHRILNHLSTTILKIRNLSRAFKRVETIACVQSFYLSFLQKKDCTQAMETTNSKAKRAAASSNEASRIVSSLWDYVHF